MDLGLPVGFPEEVTPGRKSPQTRERRVTGQSSQMDQDVLKLEGQRDLMPEIHLGRMGLKLNLRK